MHRIAARSPRETQVADCPLTSQREPTSAAALEGAFDRSDLRAWETYGEELREWVVLQVTHHLERTLPGLVESILEKSHQESESALEAFEGLQHSLWQQLREQEHRLEVWRQEIVAQLAEGVRGMDGQEEMRRFEVCVGSALDGLRADWDGRLASMAEKHRGMQVSLESLRLELVAGNLDKLRVMEGRLESAQADMHAALGESRSAMEAHLSRLQALEEAIEGRVSGLRAEDVAARHDLESRLFSRLTQQDALVEAVQNEAHASACKAEVCLQEELEALGQKLARQSEQLQEDLQGSLLAQVRQEIGSALDVSSNHLRLCEAQLKQQVQLLEECGDGLDVALTGSLP